MKMSKNESNWATLASILLAGAQATAIGMVTVLGFGALTHIII